MEYRAVKSSSLTRVGFDAKTSTLEVTFCSGRIYNYDAVPKEIANGLLNAESKGGYLAANIVGKFAYRCLNPPPPKEQDASKTKQPAKPQESKGGRKTRKIQPI